MKRVYTLLYILLCAVTISAQQGNEVTLVAMGDGPTKQEAVNVALRSAIEQAFGVFVSANTTILNDELVKDEIATLSSGNIKSFKEIASAQTAKHYSVTVEAVVSVGNLISYAKAKGSSCEFAGQTFAYNLKLKELNRKNELKVIDNLGKQLSLMAEEVFDLNIIAGDPKVAGDGYTIPLKIILSANQASEAYYRLLTQTLSTLSLNETEIADYKNTNIQTYEFSVYERFNTNPPLSADVNRSAYANRSAGVVSGTTASGTTYVVRGNTNVVTNNTSTLADYHADYHYSYNYVFRNDIKSKLIRMFTAPFQNIIYRAEFANQTKTTSIPLEQFDKKLIISTRTNGAHSIYFAYLPILLGWKNIHPERALDAKGIWWKICDPASPNTIAYDNGTRSSYDKINKAIQAHLSISGSSLYTIEITCTIPGNEIYNLTGFSVDKNRR